MRVEIDSNELDQLTADLRRAAALQGGLVRKAVEVSARKVRDKWRSEATGLAHAPAFPFSISYDLKGGAGVGGASISAEIGPDKGRPQGPLGNLIEFGSRNNPPQGLGHGALQANEGDFERGLSRAVSDSMRGAGL